MKRRFTAMFIFFGLFILFTSANAGELYKCIDSDGNKIVTDSPQDGMKDCVLKDSYEDPSPEEPTNENGKAIVKEKETPKAITTRINNCFNCCYNKIRACYNYTADSRLCIAEKQNCDATCNSGGTSPSSWSDCWSQSDK